MQHLLARAAWDHDGVRDDLRAYLVEHLGDPDGVLVVDETGDLKKGIQTVGVQRQYTGTAGRVENAQVAVLLVYAGPAGHGVIDRELYVPRSWTRDPNRLRAAGVPDQVRFATKPALATAMLCRALDAGVPASWVTGDEVYGADPTLRAWLEGRAAARQLRKMRTQASSSQSCKTALSRYRSAAGTAAKKSVVTTPPKSRSRPSWWVMAPCNH